MKSHLSMKRARAIISRFASARILVIGDLVMDHFIWGRVRRISPEAPVPVVEVDSESLMLGGSANVVNNIHSLGGRSFVTGVVGRDHDGTRLIGELKKRGIPTGGIIISSRRPTTVKTRIIAHHQQVVRFDREKRDGIGPASAKKLLAYIKRTVPRVDLVVISDYAKGLVTGPLAEETIAMCRKRGTPVAVDPKVEHFDYYMGATIITPNNLEASRASGIEIEDEASLKRAGEELMKRLECDALLITRGEHGMSLFEPGLETHIPTVAQEVFDVSGAGDTVIGSLALALASGAGFREAAVLANFAAGVVVGKVGTATLNAAELKGAALSGLGAVRASGARSAP